MYYSPLQPESGWSSHAPAATFHRHVGVVRHPQTGQDTAYGRSTAATGMSYVPDPQHTGFQWARPVVRYASQQVLTFPVQVHVPERIRAHSGTSFASISGAYPQRGVKGAATFSPSPSRPTVSGQPFLQGCDAAGRQHTSRTLTSTPSLLHLRSQTARGGSDRPGLFQAAHALNGSVQNFPYSKGLAGDPEYDDDARLQQSLATIKRPLNARIDDAATLQQSVQGYARAESAPHRTDRTCARKGPTLNAGRHPKVATELQQDSLRDFADVGPSAGSIGKNDCSWKWGGGEIASSSAGSIEKNEASWKWGREDIPVEQFEHQSHSIGAYAEECQKHDPPSSQIPASQGAEDNTNNESDVNGQESETEEAEEEDKALDDTGGLENSVCTEDAEIDDFAGIPLSVSAGDLLARDASDVLTGVDVAGAIGLFNAAMQMTVDPGEAKHPQRAKGGRLLLEEASKELAGQSPRRHPARRSLDAKNEVRVMIERLFYDSMPKQYVIVDTVDVAINPPLLKRFLSRVAQERTSIEATFHGTRPEYAAEILREGLLVKECNTACYGLGAYVGTHAGVAHQYADPDSLGNRFMYVVLVALGPRVVKGKQGVQAEVTAADRLINPTQYCFVEEDRLAVTHAIVYQNVNDVRRRIGGGWEDPFQRKLLAAIQRAGKRRRRSSPSL